MIIWSTIIWPFSNNTTLELVKVSLPALGVSIWVLFVSLSRDGVSSLLDRLYLLLPIFAKLKMRFCEGQKVEFFKQIMIKTKFDLRKEILKKRSTKHLKKYLAKRLNCMKVDSSYEKGLQTKLVFWIEKHDHVFYECHFSKRYKWNHVIIASVYLYFRHLREWQSKHDTRACKALEKCIHRYKTDIFDVID